MKKGRGSRRRAEEERAEASGHSGLSQSSMMMSGADQFAEMMAAAGYGASEIRASGLGSGLDAIDALEAGVGAGVDRAHGSSRVTRGIDDNIPDAAPSTEGAAAAVRGSSGTWHGSGPHLPQSMGVNLGPPALPKLSAHMPDSDLAEALKAGRAAPLGLGAGRRGGRRRRPAAKDKGSGDDDDDGYDGGQTPGTPVTPSPRPDTLTSRSDGVHKDPLDGDLIASLQYQPQNPNPHPLPAPWGLHADEEADMEELGRAGVGAALGAGTEGGQAPRQGQGRARPREKAPSTDGTGHKAGGVSQGAGAGSQAAAPDRQAGRRAANKTKAQGMNAAADRKPRKANNKPARSRHDEPFSNADRWMEGFDTRFDIALKNFEKARDF